MNGIELVTSNNLKKLNILLDNAGKTLKTFRYYNTRSFDVIKNHLLTIIFIEDNIPVAYGHLDEEKNKIWLGIMVVEKKLKQGFGKKIMDYLKSYIKKNNLDNIFLTVDPKNTDAIFFFKKNKFKIIGLSESGTILMKFENDRQNISE